MPIGSDPQDSTPVILGTDKGRKAKDQNFIPRTFLVRFLTSREQRQADKLIKEAREAEKSGDGDATDAKLEELFSLSLTGWEDVSHRGKPMVYGTDKATAFLSTVDLWDLANQCISAHQLAEIDLRNFGSPPASGGEASVQSASAANVTTPPPANPPSA